MEERKTITFHLGSKTKALWKWVDDQAKENNTSRTQIVIRALIAYKKSLSEKS